MAAAVLMEEELQNSIATSEEDAEFEEDDELAADMLGDEFAANNQLHNGMLAASEEGEEGEGAGADDSNSQEDDSEEISGEGSEGGSEEDLGMEAEEGGSEGEGVGAVKIQPGLSSDEEALSGTDDESVASGEGDDESKDSTDAEVEVEWDPAAEDDEEEPANPNRCMYVSLYVVMGACH